MMAADKQLFIMAGFDQETERRLNDWEAALERCGRPGRQTKNVPHHISLGMYPPTMEASVKTMVIQAASETAPFPISFQHLGIFGGGRVLFAAPCVNRALLNLKERFGPGDAWTAHATLLIDEPERIVPLIGPAIEMFEEFEGRVERLFLHEFFPTRLILDLPLSGSD